MCTEKVKGAYCTTVCEKKTSWEAWCDAGRYVASTIGNTAEKMKKVRSWQNKQGAANYRISRIWCRIQGFWRLFRDPVPRCKAAVESLASKVEESEVVLDSTDRQTGGTDPDLRSAS